jgi:predicted ester cyclase
MSGRAALVCSQLFERLDAGDDGVINELVAEDFVNHAAGPQGREGWRLTLQVLEHDLPRTGGLVQHLFGDDEFACVHMTIEGVHRNSTMPLLAGIAVTGKSVSWEFIHIFRVADGKVVEHWATRDDLGLLRQIGSF